ncbi:dynamin central domain-containing protein [Artemisia annua]|uniref:Dynamin central domain-containing protein n=1 Tax=Artemisia annua TaxID=35608 RepID=A0A2U1MZS7_ARTAN|nr:dynamin central domain-containing protein [Artemisia annua]
MKISFKHRDPHVNLNTFSPVDQAIMVKKRKASDEDISDTTTFSDHKPKSPPLVSSYNEKIRPILDAIDKLPPQSSVDFTTCESICMSRRVDCTGKRTLAVVTKCDVNPEQDGLREKVMANDVNIGLGYTCVINRINDEARVKEAQLFETHPLLSKIDKSMVGILALANKLVKIQSEIISKYLPDIVKKVNERLKASISDLNKLPVTFTTVSDAMFAFSQIVGSLKETLQRILIRGEFDQYQNYKQMHCNARLVEMLDAFSRELNTSIRFSQNFLVEEMELLEEGNGIRLQNVPHSVFLSLLQRKVDTISKLPDSLVDKVWSYIETVSVRVLTDRCENYPQLLPYVRKATLHVMREKKVQFKERVDEMIEMEKITDYTCDPEFITSYNKLMGNRSYFSALKINDYSTITIEGYGIIHIGHLKSVAANTRDQAFDLKMRMTAYWKIVLKRLVDWVVLQLRFLIQKVVNKEIEVEMHEVIVRGGGIEKMLVEPPSVAIKREELQRSIGLLKASKEVIDKSWMVTTD